MAIFMESCQGKNGPSALAIKTEDIKVIFISEQQSKPLQRLKKHIYFSVSNLFRKHCSASPIVKYKEKKCKKTKTSKVSNTNVLNYTSYSQNKRKTIVRFRRSGGNLFRNLLLTTIAFTISSIECSDSTKWELHSQPAILGKNVTLVCEISDYQNHCDRLPHQWYGGKNYSLLCENGKCRNDVKYSEIRNSACTFMLVIHNFGVEDINQDYTCTYGVQYERKALNLNEDFELRPTNNSMTSEVTTRNNSMSVHLAFTEVYPKPRCSFIFKHINISQHVKERFEAKGVFFAADFNLDYSLERNCKGDLVITCFVGTYRMNMSGTAIDKCSAINYDGTKESIETIVLGTCVLVIAIVIVLVVCLVRKKKQYRPLNWKKCCCNITNNDVV